MKFSIFSHLCKVAIFFLFMVSHSCCVIVRLCLFQAKKYGVPYKPHSNTTWINSVNLPLGKLCIVWRDLSNLDTIKPINPFFFNVQFYLDHLNGHWFLRVLLLRWLPASSHHYFGKKMPSIWATTNDYQLYFNFKPLDK